MKEVIERTILEFRSDSSIKSYDEARTRQGIISKILHLLEWDTFNIKEVEPEYGISGKRVDYCLHYPHQKKVFIEAKKTVEDLENHQEQLLDYSFHEGVELAILTNGIVWWFYLPLKPGNWDQRKFIAIELLTQDITEITERFINFLSKDQVTSGKAIELAEELLESQDRERIIKETIPRAWSKLLSENDETLVDLIAETAEEICGYKPGDNHVVNFLQRIQSEPLNQTPARTVYHHRSHLNKKLPSRPSTNDYKRTNPIKYTLQLPKNPIIKVLSRRSWAVLYRELLVILFEYNNDLINNLMSMHPGWFSTDPNCFIFKKGPQRFQLPSSIIFANTCLSANGIVERMKRLLAEYNLSNRLIILYTDKDDNEKNARF